VVTSGGPAAGIDLSLRLVERFLGDDAVARAAERIEHRRVGPTLVTGALVA
jgi:transcriptional regulator GlxA family with amidase domain